MADGQRGTLDRLEQLSKIVGTLAIPFLVGLFGYLINAHQREAEKSERYRKELLNVAEYLTDADPRKVRFGYAIIEMMRNDGAEIPAAIVELAAFVSSGPPAAVPAPPGPIAAPSEPAAPPGIDPTPSPAPAPAPAPAPRPVPPPAVQQTAPVQQMAPVQQAAIGKAASEALGGLVPRVFLHIADAAQRPAAESLKALLPRIRLGGTTIVVPGIEQVRAAPQRVELRFLKRADRDEATTLAALLATIVEPPPVLVDLSGTYDGNPAIRRRTYELWLPVTPIAVTPLSAY